MNDGDRPRDGSRHEPADDARDDLRYWVALSRIAGVGPVRLGRLMAAFEPATAWGASVGALVAAGIEGRIADQIVADRARLDPDDEWRRLERAGVRTILISDPDYPARLREISAAPPILYLRGAFTPGDDLALAVVGTRRATSYGRTVTERLVADLTAAGLTIVSGLARGIDAIAHRTALAGGGRTIAVLGSGLDYVYPSEHRSLAERIADQGAVVSDFPLGTKPDGPNFPARNRIVSGLSRGVLVTEAGRVSGARITAGFALEQNREVFAVPGSILSDLSETPNQLIQEGAKLVRSAEDILVELNLPATTDQPKLGDLLPTTPVEAAILERLTGDPAQIDDLGHETGLAAAEIAAALALLELKGLVRQVGGQQYVLARRR